MKLIAATAAGCTLPFTSLWTLITHWFPELKERRPSAFKILRIIVVSLLPVAWDCSRHGIFLLALETWRWCMELDAEYWWMTPLVIIGAADLERVRQRKKRVALELQDRVYVSWSAVVRDWFLGFWTHVVEDQGGGSHREFSPRKTFLFVLGLSFPLLWELAEKGLKQGLSTSWTFLLELDTQYWIFLGVFAGYLFTRERWRQQLARLTAKKEKQIPYQSWSDLAALWLLSAITVPVERLRDALRAEDGEPLGKCLGGSLPPACSESWQDSCSTIASACSSAPLDSLGDCGRPTETVT